MPPRQSTRRRSQPQRYQSEDADRKKQELRNRARGREAQTQPEATSHDWKEGARLGEATNPGPTNIYTYLYPHRGRDGGAGPWGQKRRKPGPAPQAQQACGCSQPYQKWYPIVTSNLRTPGNVGLSFAEDLRLGWPAGSQPRSLQPTWGGPPRVPANPWRGVHRHAVNAVPPAVPARHWQGVCRHAKTTVWPGPGGGDRVHQHGKMESYGGRGKPAKTQRVCWYGAQCKYKNLFCPFAHRGPADGGVRRRNGTTGEGPERAGVNGSKGRTRNHTPRKEAKEEKEAKAVSQ